MSHSYTTIAQGGESLWKAKGSKHIGFAMHVADEAAIDEALQAIRKSHHQANHVCYAWRLGADLQQFRSSDDGEPTHSAGPPILGQIEKHGLTFVLVAVVRYFGGTKLGVGGLIDAYRNAAQLAIEAATLEPIQLKAHFTIRFGYVRMSEVMLAVRMHNWEMYEQDFKETCAMGIAVLPQNKDEVPQVLEAYSDIESEYKGLY